MTLYLMQFNAIFSYPERTKTLYLWAIKNSERGIWTKGLHPFKPQYTPRLHTIFNKIKI